MTEEAPLKSKSQGMRLAHASYRASRLAMGDEEVSEDTRDLKVTRQKEYAAQAEARAQYSQIDVSLPDLTSLDREKFYLGYLKDRAAIYDQEVKRAPKPSDFAQGITPDAEDSNSHVFHRRQHLEGFRALGSRTLAEIVEADQLSLNRGYVQNPAAILHLAHSVEITRAFLSQENERAHEFTTQYQSDNSSLSPEDVLDFSKSNLQQIGAAALPDMPNKQMAKSLQSLLNSDNHAPLHETAHKIVGHVSASRVHATQKDHATQKNTGRFFELDILHDKAKSFAQMITRADRAIKYVEQNNLFPSEEEKSGVSRLAGAVIDRADEHRQIMNAQEKKPGRLARLLRSAPKGPGKGQQADEALADPFGEKSSVYALRVIADRTESPEAQKSARLLHDDQSAWRVERDRIASAREDIIKRDLAREDRGEYIVSRAVGSHLKKLATDLSKSNNLPPEARAQVARVQAAFPKDPRRQMSSKRLAAFAAVLAENLPNTKEFQPALLDLECAKRATSHLKQHEEKRWKDEENKTRFLSASLAKQIATKKSAAERDIFDRPSDDPILNTGIMARDMGITISRELNRNPSPERKKALEAIGKSISGKGNMSLSASDRNALVQQALTNGLIHDNAATDDLSTKLGYTLVRQDHMNIRQQDIIKGQERLRAQTATSDQTKKTDEVR